MQHTAVNMSVLVFEEAAIVIYVLEWILQGQKSSFLHKKPQNLNVQSITDLCGSAETEKFQ